MEENKLEEERIAEAIFELGMMISYHQNDFYGGNHFKVNAKCMTGLSERQFVILMTLAYTDINSLTKLAETLCSSPSNLSILISKLMKNGYVRKEYPSHSEDKRKVYFYITPEGEEKVHQITAEIETDITDFYMRLNENQKILLKEGINCFVLISTRDGTNTEEQLLSMNAADDRLIPGQILKKLTWFFNWQLHHFMKEFKVNGNDGRLLTDRQFAILLCVQRLRYNTISQMEKVLPVESSTVSNVVSKMVRDGFLTREHPDCGDGRVVYFAITEKGREILRQVAGNVRLCINDFLKTLDTAQRKNFMSGVSKLHTLFSSLQKNIF